MHARVLQEALQPGRCTGSAQTAGTISALRLPALNPGPRRSRAAGARLAHNAPRRSSRAAALVAGSALAATLALAGCGSVGSSGTTVDPASVVPASAPVFLGADVRPTGSEKTYALAVGSALTHRQDPYKQLAAVLQTPGSPAIDYSRDVAPWLGPRAGLFVTSASGASALLGIAEQGLLGTGSTGAEFPFGPGGAQGAVVLDTSDAGKAKSFVESQASHAGAARARYRGISYRRTTGGVAFAMVERFAVLGSDAGVRAVIDTAAGGSSLRAAPDYSRLLAHSPPGTLAHLFANPTALGRQAGKGGQGGGGAPATGAAAGAGVVSLFAGAREANISVVPGSNVLSIYTDSRASGATGAPGGLLASGTSGASALEALPGDSWLALGLGNLGQTLGADISGLGELAGAVGGAVGSGEQQSGTISVGGLIEGLLAPLKAMTSPGAQARRDFTSWMGSGGVFASGTGLLELKGAVVIESRNPAASRAAVGKLAALLARTGDSTRAVSIPGTEAAAQVQVRGLPVQLDIASGRTTAGGTLFVLGLGQASVTDALHPASALVSSPTKTFAEQRIGEGIAPSLIFNVSTLVGLLEGVGLTEDPAFAKIAPYAHAITTAVGGGHPIGGEVERFKLVVVLRPANG